MKRDLLGRHGDRELTRWPLRGTGQGTSEAAQRLRLTHCCPQVPMFLACGKTAIALGPDEKVGSCPRRTAHRVHKPLVDIVFPIGHIHHQRGWTGLLDLTGKRLPF
jgi:hypothetical protein